MLRRARSGMVSLAVVVAAGVVVGAGQQETTEPQGWIHVQVQGASADAQQVAINLPLGAVDAVLALAPDGFVSSEGELRIPEEHGVSVSEVRRMWRELMAAGDAQFASIQDGDRTVHIGRTGDLVEVRVEGGDDATVYIDVPVPVVDALLSGEGDTLNLAAALDRLQTLRGDIVRVRENERQIRVWVDEQSAQ